MEPNSGRKNWGNHPVIVLLGIFATVISVAVFLTGKTSLTEFFPTAIPSIELESSIPTPATTIFVPTQTLPLVTSVVQSETSEPLGIGSTMVSSMDGMLLLYVPKGEFTMGSEDGDENEKPIHTVNLDAFWIDQTEVTNAMFAKFLNQEGNQAEDGVIWLDSGSADVHIHLSGNKWQMDSGYEDHPVVEVSWYGANAYCNWAVRRLPTEAEWEKAARGDNGNIYPWGDAVPNNDLLNIYTSVSKTTKVGSYPTGASVYGALDMAGNVWEWVSSLHKSYPYNANDGRENLSIPGSRVTRGLSWYAIVNIVRSTSRFSDDPSSTSPVVGFRCAVSE